MNKRDEWFVWERQARIHSLFIPLEAAMEPLRKYFGQSWPDTTLVYRGSIVKWLNRLKPLKKLGQKMIDYYLDKNNLDKMTADLQAEQSKLEEIFERTDMANLTKLADREIMELYVQFRKRYIEWYKIGWLVEPISLRSEDLLKEAGIAQKNISLLTAAEKDSFSKRELKDMLEIAVHKKAGENVGQLFEAHARKYFWIHNSYYAAGVLGTNHFKKELAGVLRQYPQPEKYLGGMNAADREAIAKKNKLVAELGIGEKVRQLVELVSRFVWLQDYRKEYVLRANHCLNVILREIGRRKKFTETEMAYTVPRDIPRIMEGLFSKTELRKRMKNCLITWKEFHDDYVLFTGAEALRKAEQVFKETSPSQEIIEIQGLSANIGRRTGTAFVTFDPKDAKKMGDGEILVTSMTSPEFIEAMKKAGALATDEGGTTSHAAILAREFGLPCVVGTKIATKAIKTGDYIEVDGNHGFVRKLEK